MTVSDREELYRRRLRRYVTAMRNGQPDMVPIRPFVAEFTASHAGFTCQQVTHDYELAFEAARRCAADFDWDAVVANMVYVWTGMTQALGLRYYGIPGIDVGPNSPFQYREPGEDEAFMREDEYDRLIDDPTAFLYEVWLPRVSTVVRGGGAPSSYTGNVALVKGSMAMLRYFMAFGPQCARLRSECGTVSAIAGILKAPFDILADKLRGYIGLTMDMATQPKKVLKACEALMPHLYQVARTSADPAHQVPIGYWMHRGCIPFVRKGQFESHYWPTIRPVVEELWRGGHQTLFYAEGDWTHHLDSFAQLPAGSIVYHVDRGDIFEVHRRLGGRFCLSGGIPNALLSYGTPDQVRECCRRVIEGVAREGGYIMDASAIMQVETRSENLRALTEATREYGVYSSASAGDGVGPGDDWRIVPADGTRFDAGYGMDPDALRASRAGVCMSWESKAGGLGVLPGDADLAQRVWEDVEGLANMFIWQLLVSF